MAINLTKKINLYNKKILGRNEFENEFLNYLLDKIKDSHKSLFPTSGVLAGPITASKVGVGSSNILAKVVTTGGYGTYLKGTNSDGLCFVADFEDADSGNVLSGWACPNDSGQIYYLYTNLVLIPDGVELSSSGRFEYARNKEYLGFVGHPESIAEESGNLRIVLGSIGGMTEGNLHGGKCVVWMVPKPFTGISSDAIQRCTIDYDSNTQNEILTDGPLGQTVSAASVDPYDYMVCLEGIGCSESDYSSESVVQFISNEVDRKIEPGNSWTDGGLHSFSASSGYLDLVANNVGEHAYLPDARITNLTVSERYQLRISVAELSEGSEWEVLYGTQTIASSITAASNGIELTFNFLASVAAGDLKIQAKTLDPESSTATGRFDTVSITNPYFPEYVGLGYFEGAGTTTEPLYSNDANYKEYAVDLGNIIDILKTEHDTDGAGSGHHKNITIGVYENVDGVKFKSNLGSGDTQDFLTTDGVLVRKDIAGPTVSFSGSGNNDLIMSGSLIFNLDEDIEYTVTVTKGDNSIPPASPNEIKVEAAGYGEIFNNDIQSGLYEYHAATGMQMAFGSLTGHDENDRWTFTAFKKNSIVFPSGTDIGNFDRHSRLKLLGYLGGDAVNNGMYKVKNKYVLDGDRYAITLEDDTVYAPITDPHKYVDISTIVNSNQDNIDIYHSENILELWENDGITPIYIIGAGNGANFNSEFYMAGGSITEYDKHFLGDTTIGDTSADNLIIFATSDFKSAALFREDVTFYDSVIIRTNNYPLKIQNGSGSDIFKVSVNGQAEFNRLISGSALIVNAFPGDTANTFEFRESGVSRFHLTAAGCLVTEARSGYTGNLITLRNNNAPTVVERFYVTYQGTIVNKAPASGFTGNLIDLGINTVGSRFTVDYQGIITSLTPSGFIGNIIDLQNNGVSVFSVDQAGKAILSSDLKFKDATGTSSGTDINISGSDASISGVGGDLTIKAGAAKGTNLRGGRAVLSSGNNIGTPTFTGDADDPWTQLQSYDSSGDRTSIAYGPLISGTNKSFFGRVAGNARPDLGRDDSLDTLWGTAWLDYISIEGHGTSTPAFQVHNSRGPTNSNGSNFLLLGSQAYGTGFGGDLTFKAGKSQGSSGRGGRVILSGGECTATSDPFNDSDDDPRVILQSYIWNGSIVDAISVGLGPTTSDSLAYFGRMGGTAIIDLGKSSGARFGTAYLTNIDCSGNTVLGDSLSDSFDLNAGIVSHLVFQANQSSGDGILREIIGSHANTGGVGGNLKLRAGTGIDSNNSGGNLIIEGGICDGTGISAVGLVSRYSTTNRLGIAFSAITATTGWFGPSAIDSTICKAWDLGRNTTADTRWGTGYLTLLDINAVSGFAGEIVNVKLNGVQKFWINEDGSIISKSSIDAETYSKCKTGFICDTASGFTGNLIDLRVNTSSKFTVDETGVVSSVTHIQADGNIVADANDNGIGSYLMGPNVVINANDTFVGSGGVDTTSSVKADGGVAAGSTDDLLKWKKFEATIVVGSGNTYTFTHGLTVGKIVNVVGRHFTDDDGDDYLFYPSGSTVASSLNNDSNFYIDSADTTKITLVTDTIIDVGDTLIFIVFYLP